jgi:hypothetical protein
MEIMRAGRLTPAEAAPIAAVRLTRVSKPQINWFSLRFY